MNMNCTLLQAKVSPILACARTGLGKGLVNRKILILSDTQTALLAVKEYQLKSKLVIQGHSHTLERLASRNTVMLRAPWTPRNREK